MTDERGMLQFCHHADPDPDSGYTVDDNARALIVALNSREDDRIEYALRYTKFLVASQRESGDWCNWWLPKRGFVTDIDSNDSLGRAFLASSLGVLADVDEVSAMCRSMVIKALPIIKHLRSPRSVAYTLMGCSKLIEVTDFERDVYNLAQQEGTLLTNLYFQNRSTRWRWFEDRFTYCNAALPHALFAYYSIKADKRALSAAEESLRFIADKLFARGFLNIVGNKGWWVRDGEMALFDQQPVDACSLTLACLKAYEVTGHAEYREMSDLAYSWYTGKNIVNLSLYNQETGGCHDGLTPDGLNLNQGAEAILSLLLSNQAMEGNK